MTFSLPSPSSDLKVPVLNSLLSDCGNVSLGNEFSLRFMRNFAVTNKRSKVSCQCQRLRSGGNRSSRPKVISPEVMSPETRVISPENYS